MESELSMDKKELLERESLRGLEGVSVVIEEMTPQVEDDGLTKAELKQEVELRIHKAGIQVLPEQDATVPGSAYLYVNINLIKTGIGLYVYASRVALKQELVLPREPLMEFYAATWEIAGVGTVGINNLRGIVENISEHVDRFVKDYLAVNPSRAVQDSSPFNIKSRVDQFRCEW